MPARTASTATAALSENVPENVTELRRLEGARLDRLQAAVWPKALSGDPAAVRAVVRLMERRARLLGLDAPVQVEFVDEKVEQQLAEFRLALAADADVLQLIPPAAGD